jgi:epoxyqueuosine reductase
MTQAQQVKTKARELDCTFVGIATAAELQEEGRHLGLWLERGFHASMQWMSERREKRTNLQAVLPGARSVVSVALNYYSPVAHASDPGTGKISRYAWGDDYHDVLGTRLKQLQDWMTREFPGSRNLWYVDTGPVMEKAWAQRAGIGWIGKHTNVITREQGSWVFLGEVFTTLDLDPDPPETDHCGTCTLCIEACPTGAIVEPYVLDAGRCISYLTIEHRGPLPESLTPKFEQWIFGCDICQDVCPWNQKFATAAREPAFLPRPGNETPPLNTWAAMNEEEFGRKFRGSPVRRARWSGLLRNIRAVLDPKGKTAA